MQKCAGIEKWSARVLEKKISSMLYERTASSKQPESVIQHGLGTLRPEDRLSEWHRLFMADASPAFTPTFF